MTTPKIYNKKEVLLPEMFSYNTKERQYKFPTARIVELAYNAICDSNYEACYWFSYSMSYKDVIKQHKEECISHIGKIQKNIEDSLECIESIYLYGLLRGENLQIIDIEDGIVYNINLDRLLTSVCAVALDSVEDASKIKEAPIILDQLDEIWDFDTADTIMQHAVFGKVVYA